MNHVPFNIDSVFMGFVRVHGIATDIGEGIRLEFKYEDNIIHSFKSAVKEVVIPLEDLESVTLKPGFWGFGAKIVVQAKRLESIEKIPGLENGRVKLSVKRHDLPAARKFVQDLHEFDEEKIAT